MVEKYNELFDISGPQVSKQLLVQIQDPENPSVKQDIKVYGWAKVFQFKQLITKTEHFQNTCLSQLRLIHKNIELSNDRKTLLDYNISNGSIIVAQRRNKIQSGSKGVINPYKLFDRANEKVTGLVQSTIEAINQENLPELTSQGTSGVYMIKNRRQNEKPLSIFKPFDEEVNAPNNPRGRANKLGSDGIAKGILSGECATREVAAYLLDNEGNNFHTVPTTTYVEFYHPTFIHKQIIDKTPITCCQQKILNFGASKHGSLQQFVVSQGLIGDYGSKRFSNSQIHKIAILDIRILNCDRNQQNILVSQASKTNLKLIPIDHGLSLPDNLEIYEDTILWMSYPQSKAPFSEEQLRFIQEINPAKDVEILQSKLGFRQICLRNFRIAEIFLKKAAAFGFTLYEMGKMLYRAEDNIGQQMKSKRSSIETIVMQAQNLYQHALETMEKQNVNPQQNTLDEGKQQDEEDQDMLDYLLEQSEEETNQNSSSAFSSSSSTCGSIKSIFKLRKKVSLPQLTRKNTSYHESISKARKEREGINGTSKTIWNKYHQQQWNQVFYYYFQNLLETFLTEKSMSKTRKLSLKSESAK